MRGKSRFRPFAACVALAFGLASIAADAQTVIGVVYDGPLPRPIVPIDELQAEIQELVGAEFEIDMPASKQLDGSWTLDGIRQAIRQLLNDSDVDIVIANGLIASNEVARIADLPKPVIAPIVADAQLQGLPASLSGSSVVSGKRNLVYIARRSVDSEPESGEERTTIDESIDIFHDAVQFRHIAVLIDRLTIEAIPRLASEKAREVSERLAVRATVVPYEGAIGGMLAAIPADADAVLVGPLLRLSASGMRELADGLIARGLPSFALLGREELAYGLLMSSGGREQDSIRYVRRIALDVQSILLGDDPGGIDVGIAEPQRLAINMRAADAIGFYPRYAVLVDAEQLYAESSEDGDVLGIREAMAEALQSNLALAVADYDPIIAAENRKLARAQLLPQLGIGARAVQIDEDRANPLVQPERSTDAIISGSQVVLSDEIRAGWKIAAYLESAAHQGHEVEVLNTLQSSARGYLGVLRARALEDVRRSNLEVTRTNLELARLRGSIGASGRGDVLRWQSQLATDRRNLVAAEAERKVALTAFNQILNRPKNQEFVPADEDISSSIAVFQDPRFRSFIDNAAVWALFQAYLVEQTLDRSPELIQIDRLLAAQQRQVLSARRKYYLPDVSLSGMLGTNMSRSGAGSNLSLNGQDDNSWSVALSASWPLFSSGALRANLNKERFSFGQLKRSRAALAEQLETRTLIALHRASGSYPALEFSQEAAAAAAENLVLVTDAYRSGAVSVTELIDAQNASVAADLLAVDAGYAYLIDVVDILRATADFALLVEPGSKEPWFQQVESYIRQHGGTGPR